MPVKTKSKKKSAASKKRRYRVRGTASVPCTCADAAPTRVLRTTRAGPAVLRERQCTKCEQRVFTQETPMRPVVVNASAPKVPS